MSTRISNCENEGFNHSVTPSATLNHEIEIHHYEYDELAFKDGNHLVGIINRKVSNRIKAFYQRQAMERLIDYALESIWTKRTQSTNEVAEQHGPNGRALQSFLAILKSLPGARILVLSHEILAGLDANNNEPTFVSELNLPLADTFVSPSRSNQPATIKVLPGPWAEVNHLLLDKFNIIFGVGKSDHQAISRFCPNLDSTVVLVVEHWNQSEIRQSLLQVVERTGFSICSKREVSTHFSEDEQWGNGIGILCLQKQPIKLHPPDRL
jgi:hypothetical protein